MNNSVRSMLAVAFILVLAGCSQPHQSPTEAELQSDQQLVGGDQDEHGCLTGAGYSWCEPLQKCVRFWEEPCKQDSKDANQQNREAEMDCEADSDCIPLPSDCHPRSCINKGYELMHEPPEMCTMMFDCEAAYEPEDCLCKNGKCANGNEGKQCN